MEKAQLLIMRYEQSISTYLRLSCVGSRDLLGYLKSLGTATKLRLLGYPGDFERKQLSDFTDQVPMELYFKIKIPLVEFTGNKRLSHKQIKGILENFILTTVVISAGTLDMLMTGKEVYDIMVDRDKLTNKTYDSEDLMFIQDLMKQRPIL